MILGVDLDNTLVCYDEAFYRAALEKGWVMEDFPRSKEKVRNFLRSKDGEEQWIELQGLVYGIRMNHASFFPGALAFIQEFLEEGNLLYIISHRTQYPFRGEPHDLHQAALVWLERQGLFKQSNLFTRENVFLELTKEKKLERIRQKGCEYFIDDLPEFFSEPLFPSKTTKVLFDPHDQHGESGGLKRARSWQEMRRILPWKRKVLA